MMSSAMDYAVEAVRSELSLEAAAAFEAERRRITEAHPDVWFQGQTLGGDTWRIVRSHSPEARPLFGDVPAPDAWRTFLSFALLTPLGNG